MVIYRLEHLHESTEKRCGGAKMLGCYSSMASIERAREEYRNVEGFSLYPNGFCVFKCIVEGETDCKYKFVYLVELYIHDESYEFEYSTCLGTFGNYSDAKRCLMEFNILNNDIIENGKMDAKCYISKYSIDKMEWIDGFK